MKTLNQTECSIALDELCTRIKGLVLEQDFNSCESIIYKAMIDYPHSPQPHNLLGIVLEKTGNHALAMKHFRAAWALDPAYRPANHNLETYGTFHSRGRCAFDESDIPEAAPCRFSAGGNGEGTVKTAKAR